MLRRAWEGGQTVQRTERSRGRVAARPGVAGSIFPMVSLPAASGGVIEAAPGKLGRGEASGGREEGGECAGVLN